MKYVRFGDLGFEISRLGFGAMRLPRVKNGDKWRADEDRGVALLREGMDGGVTYLDTAYGYMGGVSESIVGKAVRDGYREKVKIATKLPCWLVETRQDMDKLLDEQLARLGLPYVDFYLLHALNKGNWQKMKKLGAREFLDAAVKDGRIRYPGFSFHDNYRAFKQILDGYDWRMAQIQYNYLDMYADPGNSGLRYAAKKGVPLVVMEPLRGGALANPPKEVKALMDKAAPGRDPVEWAFRFVADKENVPVVLSGMSDSSNVRQNLELFDKLEMNALTEADIKQYRKLRLAYLGRVPVGCTGCEYCMPCPKGVNIPRIFDMYNEAFMLERPGAMGWRYADLAKNKQDAAQCVGCGVCEGKCPQKVAIRDWLKKAHAFSGMGE